tara:strand:- start:77 stop:625 length:549 start_codon:yes stop_codon:yes gene_type:complete
MAFKMKGSAFKLNNVATKSALTMKSPLEQETVNIADPFNNPGGGGATHNAWATQSTKGKGDKKRYKRRVIGQAQWIRDNYGTGLNNDERKEAQRAFYKLHNPEQPVVEKTEPIYSGEEKVKEKKYPTNKLKEGSGADVELMNKNLGEEVWDPTLNGGEGGYIRRKAADGNSEIPNETDNYSF